MTWNKERFYDFILENKIIGFFKEPIKLSSGRMSNWYVNWRTVAEDTYLFDILTDFVLEFTNYLKLKPDCFFGVPEGATKLGLITQFKWAKSQKNYRKGTFIFSMGRGAPKEHGDPKDKYFLGVPKGKVVVLEDVTTTGGSILSIIKNLLDMKIQIIAAIGLTNRNEKRDDGKSVEEALNEFRVPYYAMSDAIELLPRLKPTADIEKVLKEYFKKYGIKEIKF